MMMFSPKHAALANQRESFTLSFEQSKDRSGDKGQDEEDNEMLEADLNHALAKANLKHYKWPPQPVLPPTWQSARQKGTLVKRREGGVWGHRPTLNTILLLFSFVFVC